MNSPPSPVAVAIARVFLVAIGVAASGLAAVLYFTGADEPLWVWPLLISIGIVAILSACFEPSSGVVATAFTFFYPLS